MHKILIVDDNQLIHDDFEKILAQDVHLSELVEVESLLFGDTTSPAMDPQIESSLSHAFQGEDAVKLVKQAMAEGVPFDIAFVDMRMPPGWDGVKSIEELWKIDPELQVVICTAFSDYAWSDVLGRLGQTDNLLILKKPFDGAEVTQLAAVLSRKRKLANTVASFPLDSEPTEKKQTKETPLRTHKGAKGSSLIGS